MRPGLSGRTAPTWLALLIACAGLGLATRAQAVWPTPGGGTAADQGNAIAAGPSGNLYVVGTFRGIARFGGVTLTSSGGSEDAYVAKYDPSGAVLWAKAVGGIGVEDGFAVAVDESDHVYIAGIFQSASITFDPTISITNSIPDLRNPDGFVASLPLDRRTR